MDVICLDDEAAEESGGTVEEQAEESDDLLPDYPVPSLRKVAHEQPVNAEPIALLKVDPNVSERKGKRKAKSSSSDRDELQAQKMEKRARQAAERAEKRMHKEMDRQLKQAEKDARREESAGERQKHLIVLLDYGLSKNEVLMDELVVRMAQYDIPHRSVSHPTPATVRWTRTVSQRTVDDTAQLIVHKEEKEEAFVLAQLEAVEFAALICGDIATRKGELVGAQSSLTGYVTHLHQVYPLCKIILAVMGMETYHQNVKTKKNRKFREQVRSQASSSSQVVGSSNEPVVSMEDVHEAVVGLQLQAACVVRLVENEGSFADLIVCYTRAIADAPFKKDDLFSFHAEYRPGFTKKSSVAEDMSLTWQHMLMQFNHVSTQVANAIVSVYPSPSSLLKAYSKCGSPKEAELLLQDIVIRRGAGVTASSRRVGPVLSRRIHTYFTCSNGETMLC